MFASVLDATKGVSATCAAAPLSNATLSMRALKTPSRLCSGDHGMKVLHMPSRKIAKASFGEQY
jgi:hypothetical protein